MFLYGAKREKILKKINKSNSGNSTFKKAKISFFPSLFFSHCGESMFMVKTYYSNPFSKRGPDEYVCPACLYSFKLDSPHC